MGLFNRGFNRTKSGESVAEQVAATKLPGLVKLRALQFLLFGLVAVGAVGGVVGLASFGDEGVSIDEISTEAAAKIEAPGDLGVGGFGEVYVSVWLSSGSTSLESLKPYFPDAVNMVGVESDRFWPAHTATVDVEAVGEGYWSVTVAADVLERTEEAVLVPSGIRFYIFGVVKSEGGFVATSLPAQIPAPPTLEAPERVIEQLERPTGELEPVSQAAQGFFSALLAGSGDIDRFVAPDTTIVPISPAPFVSVEVSRVGAKQEQADPTRILVRVEVEAISATGNSQILQYTIVFKSRADRWEVLDLTGATPLMETNQ